MAFLKTLFWVIVAVIVALLWQNTPRADLPIGTDETGGLVINARLGTWMIASFLIGFIPLYLFHKTMQWRMGRRIRTLEDQIARLNAPEPKTVETPAAQPEAAPAATQDRAGPAQSGPSPAEIAASDSGGKAAEDAEAGPREGDSKGISS